MVLSAFVVLVTYTWSKTVADPETVSVDVELSMRQAGSSDALTSSAYFGYFDGPSGAEASSFSLCPWSYEPSAGPFAVTGSIKSNFDFGSPSEAPLGPSTVTVIQNPSTMSRLKVEKDEYGYYTVSGKATAATSTKGRLGAEGTIQISIKKPASRKWKATTPTSPDSFGDWEAYLTDDVSRGWQMKAERDDYNWCPTQADWHVSGASGGRRVPGARPPDDGRQVAMIR